MFLLLVGEQFIFHKQHIQLFLNIYQLGHILYIFLRRLKEYILFNTQQHNNLLRNVQQELK